MLCVALSEGKLEFQVNAKNIQATFNDYPWQPISKAPPDNGLHLDIKTSVILGSDKLFDEETTSSNSGKTNEISTEGHC